jgi:hypothetical protein
MGNRGELDDSEITQERQVSGTEVPALSFSLIQNSKTSSINWIGLERVESW